MLATRFAASNCHSMQHKVVLEVMREGAAQAAAGDLASLRVMASESALWFPCHAQSMDAALALLAVPVQGYMGAATDGLRAATW